MQLRLTMPGSTTSYDDSEEQVLVRSEIDISKAGFAAARAVRTWLRQMPFVPSTGDLHFNITAEVEQDPASMVHEQDKVTVPAPKRKRKGKK